MKRKVIALLLLFLMTLPSTLLAASVYQDTNRFAYGFKRVMMAPFQIPIQTAQWTMHGPLVTGTVSGVLMGTFQTVGDMVGGMFDMAAAAAPYAKYAAFFA